MVFNDTRDIGLTAHFPEEETLFFYQEGKEVGRFWFDEGKFMFEGNADKSAEIFLEALKRLSK